MTQSMERRRGRGKPFLKGNDARRFGKGKTHSEETRKLLSKIQFGKPKKRHHKTSEAQRARESVAYYQWRKAVFERDNYTCMICHARGGNLNAHHIKEFAKYPELRFEIANGITLCVPCHQKRHNYKLYKMGVS